MLVAAWRYRSFVWSAIVGDFKSRFARSKLGGAWLILHPLAQVIMYALVLSTVLSAKLPGVSSRYSYSIYLVSGIVAWSLFSDVIQRCLTIFIEHSDLLKKVSFPRICLPMIVAGSVTINSLLLLLTSIAVFGILGHYPTIDFLWLPLLLLVTLALGMGIGLILGVLNVFFRDIGQIVPVVLQFAFWFTPIVYTADILPESYRPYLQLNPMYHVVDAFHHVLVYRTSPEWEGLFFVSGASVSLLAFGLILFRRASSDIADAL